jgi:hypothetical protein
MKLFLFTIAFLVPILVAPAMAHDSNSGYRKETEARSFVAVDRTSAHACQSDEFGRRGRRPRAENACLESCDREYAADSAACGTEPTLQGKAVCYARAANVYASCLREC